MKKKKRGVMDTGYQQLLLVEGQATVIQWERMAPDLSKQGVWNGYPPQYPCLENSMDRGAWLATVHRVPESQTQLSN